MNFTTQEQEMLIDAIQLAINSNRRQMTSRPQYSIITRQIDTDLQNLQLKIKNYKPEIPATKK